MAKIAAALDQALRRREQSGEAGRTTSRVLASGDGWRIADVLCTSGQADRAYEEQHSQFAIALVVAGSFEHRTADGRAVMTPGSTMLGNAGACFECGHAHGRGDRCIAFWYSPAFVERIAEAVPNTRTRFIVPVLPPLPETTRLAAMASAAVLGADGISWNELAVDVASSVLQLASGSSTVPVRQQRQSEARISDAARFIEEHLELPLTLDRLAAGAELSPFHFLRTFEAVVGVTPHQYVRRSRLRLAASRLLFERGRIIDIALDSGFADVSNFNRSFRSEFGETPRQFRSSARNMSARKRWRHVDRRAR